MILVRTKGHFSTTSRRAAKHLCSAATNALITHMTATQARTDRPAITGTDWPIGSRSSKAVGPSGLSRRSE